MHLLWWFARYSFRVFRSFMFETETLTDMVGFHDEVFRDTVAGDNTVGEVISFSEEGFL